MKRKYKKLEKVGGVCLSSVRLVLIMCGNLVLTKE